MPPAMDHLEVTCSTPLPLPLPYRVKYPTHLSTTDVKLPSGTHLLIKCPGYTGEKFKSLFDRYIKLPFFLALITVFKSLYKLTSRAQYAPTDDRHTLL